MELKILVCPKVVNNYCLNPKVITKPYKVVNNYFASNLISNYYKEIDILRI